MNGHFSRFTTDKLLDFLKRLDRKVTIRSARTNQANRIRKSASACDTTTKASWLLAIVAAASPTEVVVPRYQQTLVFYGEHRIDPAKRAGQRAAGYRVFHLYGEGIDRGRALFRLLDSVLRGVADGEHRNRISLDGEEDAENATPLAVKALAYLDTEAIRFLAGHRVPQGAFSKLGDRFL